MCSPACRAAYCAVDKAGGVASVAGVASYPHSLANASVRSSSPVETHRYVCRIARFYRFALVLGLCAAAVGEYAPDDKRLVPSVVYLEASGLHRVAVEHSELQTALLEHKQSALAGCVRWLGRDGGGCVCCYCKKYGRNPHLSRILAVAVVNESEASTM